MTGVVFMKAKAKFQTSESTNQRGVAVLLSARGPGAALAWGPPGKRVRQENDTRALPLRAWQERARLVCLLKEALSTLS